MDIQDAGHLVTGMGFGQTQDLHSCVVPGRSPLVCGPHRSSSMKEDNRDMTTEVEGEPIMFQAASTLCFAQVSSLNPIPFFPNIHFIFTEESDDTQSG